MQRPAYVHRKERLATPLKKPNLSCTFESFENQRDLLALVPAKKASKRKYSIFAPLYRRAVHRTQARNTKLLIFLLLDLLLSDLLSSSDSR